MVLRDVWAVAKCWQFAAGVPAAVAFLRDCEAHKYVATYDRVVAPLVDTQISDEVLRAFVRDALRCAGVKACYVVHSYAVLAAVPFDPALGALGGAFARLYDDLIDEMEQSDLDDRLAELFAGSTFTGRTDHERLMHALHDAIADRLDRPRTDAIYLALNELHRFQMQSRRQRHPGVPQEVLDEITRGKGATGAVALFALTKPVMDDQEVRLISDLGIVLQHLDDYIDVPTDRRNGRATPMTTGAIVLADVSAQLRALYPRLARRYGRAATRRFAASLLYMLGIGYLKRRWLPPRQPSQHGRWRCTRSPLRMMMVGADGPLQGPRRSAFVTDGRVIAVRRGPLFLLLLWLVLAPASWIRALAVAMTALPVWAVRTAPSATGWPVGPAWPGQAGSAQHIGRLRPDDRAESR